MGSEFLKIKVEDVTKPITSSIKNITTILVVNVNPIRDISFSNEGGDLLDSKNLQLFDSMGRKLLTNI